MAKTLATTVVEPTATNGQQRRDIKFVLPTFTTFQVRLEGTSPLITDAFSEDAKDKLARTQDGSPKIKPGPRDPAKEFHNSQYIMPDGQPGVPKLAFRKAIQTAAVRMTDLKGTETLASFQVNTPAEWIPLEAGEPRMRIDHVVRVGRGNLAYRAEFYPWAVILPIKLDEDIVSLDQFVDVLAKAGMGVGIGNWRPEKKGDFGMWEIVDLLDVSTVDVR